MLGGSEPFALQALNALLASLFFGRMLNQKDRTKASPTAPTPNDTQAKAGVLAVFDS